MLRHPSSVRDDKQSMQGISPILAVPFLGRRAAGGVGAIRHSSGGKFLGNAGILLLRDGPLLPNGPNLQNWKLYLGVSRAELKLKVIDLSMVEIAFLCWIEYLE